MSQNKLDLTKIDDFSFSAVMRKLRKELSSEELNRFLSIHKSYFDAAVKEDLQKPETIALTKALIQLHKTIPIKINKDMVKEAAISELGDSLQVGQYLANIIKFIMQRISLENRPNSINSLKQKLYNLSDSEISNKKMPASSAMGQCITLVKHLLFSHDPRYVREVINNIIRHL